MFLLMRRLNLGHVLLSGPVHADSQLLCCYGSKQACIVKLSRYKYSKLGNKQHGCNETLDNKLKLCPVPVPNNKIENKVNFT